MYTVHRGKYKINQSDVEKYISEEGITTNQIETIDIVLEDYGDESPHYLSELTHKERPWKQTRGSLPAESLSNTVINKDIIQDYYTGLLSEL